MSLRITAKDIYNRSFIDKKIDEYIKEFLNAISDLIEKAASNHFESVIYEVPSILTDIHINPMEVRKIICYRLVRIIVNAGYDVGVSKTNNNIYRIKITWKLAYNKKKMKLIEEFLDQYQI